LKPAKPAAPAALPVQPVTRAEAITSTGRVVPVEYGIMDASTLLTSHTDDLRENPAYPQALQPRDRTRNATEMQMQGLLNPAKFRPELLGPSPDAANGAPIVGADGLVESGNMRVMALRRAYGQDLPAATAYRAYLESQGYPVAGVKMPILVRVNRAGMTGAEREAFAREANKPAVAAMSSTERAMSDARQVSDATFDLVQPGDLMSAGNRNFVRTLLGRIASPNEMPGLVDPSGALSQDGLRRVQGAILAKAYGDPGIVQTLLESTDGNYKAIGAALLDAAPSWAKMRAAAAEGRIPPEMDITPNLTQAVNLIAQARDEGRNIVEYVKQADIFSGAAVPPETEAALRWMLGGPDFTKRVGQAKISNAANFYAQEALKVQPGPSLFGDTTTVKPLELTEAARARAQAKPEPEADLLSQGVGQRQGPTGVGEGAGTRGPTGGEPGTRPGGESAPGDLREEPALPINAPEATAEELAKRERASQKQTAEATMRGRKVAKKPQESAEELPLFGGKRQGELLAGEGSSGAGVQQDLRSALAQFVQRTGQRVSALHDAVVDFLRERAAQTGHEAVVVLDRVRGGVLGATTSGLPQSVGFTGDMIRAIGNQNYHLDIYHNHPSGMALSLPDIVTAAGDGVHWLTAVTQDGRISAIQFTPMGRAYLNEARTQGFRELLLQGAQMDAVRAASKVLDPLVLSGALSRENASRALTDLVPRALDRIGFADYLSSFPPTEYLSADVAERALAAAAKAIADGIPDEYLNGARNAGPDRATGTISLADGVARISGEAQGVAPGRPAGQSVNPPSRGRPSAQYQPRLPGLEAKGAGEQEEQEVSPPFYSALTRAVGDLKLERAPGPQWASTIGNLKGVKQEELDWSGVRDWLKDQHGAVSKAQVMDYLREHEVQVHEVTHGKSRDETVPDEQAAKDHAAAWDALNAKINDVDRREKEAHYAGRTVESADLRREYSNLSEEREQLHGRMVDETMARQSLSGKPAKFGQYTLPGGVPDSYREMLLTLPTKPGSAAAEMAEASRARTEAMAALKAASEEFGQDDSRTVAADLEWRRANQALNDAQRRADQEPKPFRSPHWGEPNVLAHVRFDDRTGPNGERVLHVAEVQSDWGQSGRKRGFKGSGPAIRNYASYGAEHGMTPLETERTWRTDDPRYKAWESEQREASEEALRVPAMPFKNSWPELAMKRMVRYAAENGYDRLSWDTGDTNADRYDLSQQVEDVSYAKNRNGTYQIFATPKGKEGEINLGEHAPEKLSDAVGKDLADKIQNGEGQPNYEGTFHTLSGVDLKVGGEGMRSFYDRQLPIVANKIGKPFGAKVEPTTIPAGTNFFHYEGPNHTPESWQNVGGLAHRDGASLYKQWVDVDRAIGRGEPFSEAMDESGSSMLAQLAGGKMLPGPATAPAHSIPITPAMRAGVVRGQALFEEPATYVEASDRMDDTVADIAAGRAPLPGEPPGTPPTGPAAAAAAGRMPPPPTTSGVAKLGAAFKYIMFPRVLAARDAAFAKLYQAFKDRQMTAQANIEQNRRKITDYINANADSSKKVAAVEEIARISGLDLQDTGRPLVVRNDNGIARDRFMALARKDQVKMLRRRGFTTQAANEALVKMAAGDAVTDRQVMGRLNPRMENSTAGDIIRLNAAETKMFFDKKGMYGDIWRSIGDAAARSMGVTGDTSVQGLRDQLQAATDRGAMKKIGRALELVQGIDNQARVGYAPLMRSGDYKIAVKMKPGRDGELIGGFPKTEYSTNVPSETPFSQLFASGQRPVGEIPAAAKEVIQNLRQEYGITDSPDDAYEITHGYQQLDRSWLRDLNIPAMDKLFDLMENKMSLENREKVQNGTMTDDMRSAADKFYREALDTIQQQLFDEMKSGFRKRSLNVSGYDGDFRRSTGRYLHYTSHWIADKLYGQSIEDAHDDLKNNAAVDPRVKAYAKDWLDYQNRPTDMLGHAANTLNQVGFYWTMAANPSTSLAILLHSPQVAHAVLAAGIGGGPGKLGGIRAGAEIYRALMEGLRSIRVGKDGLDIDPTRYARDDQERAFLQGLEDRGELHARAIDEIRAMETPQSNLAGEAGGKWQRMLKILGSNVSTFDRIVRTASAKAAYRLARDPTILARQAEFWKNERVFQEMAAREGVTPEMMGHFMLTKAANEYGRINSLPLQRSGLGHIAFQFQQFRMRYLSTMLDLTKNLGPEGKAAAGIMAGNLFLLAGMGAMPFFQDAENLYDEANKFWRKYDPMIGTQLYKLVSDIGFGKMGAEAILRGPASAFLGVNLSSRLEFGDIASRESQGLDILPIASVMWNAIHGAVTRYPTQGGVAAAAQAAPAPVRNALQATTVWPQQGIRSQTGKTMYLPPGQISTSDLLKKGFGLNPMDAERAYQYAGPRFERLQDQRQRIRPWAGANPYPRPGE
jgi:hypothetical protein